MRETASSAPVARVRPFRASDEAAWDAYVLGHPRATFFHQTGWRRVLRTTFGYEDRYLVAERDGGICGVLPLFSCRNLRGRRGLYSLPHTVYGGPVGDDRAAEEALVSEARRLGLALGATAIDLRNRHRNTLDLPLDGSCVTFEKELPGKVEEVYRTFPKKAREMINQSTKRWKLEADFDGGLDEFYDLLCWSYLKLGTPVFPKAFFRSMIGQFPEDSSILVVRHEGRAVAAVLSMVFRGTMMPLYSGEGPDVHHLKANNFKYYRLMERAVERGCRRFDFGRSRANNEGVVAFKTNQGFVAEVLPYQVESLRGEAQKRANPNEGIFVKIRGLWRKMPPRLARTVGPALVRFFP
jgi:FemAB-related protein (PEP-CTERM system-associated)